MSDIAVSPTQTEAKRFFVDKVVTQARVEGVPLSDAERNMLSWSESDPDYIVDPGLPLQLESEISDQEYEEKVAGLLARSFQADTAHDPAAETEWRQAADVLGQGDHYMLIMLDLAQRNRAGAPAGGPHIAATAGLFLLLVVPGTIALLLAAGFAAYAISGEWGGDDSSPLVNALALTVALLFLGGSGMYLFRLWFRERRW